MNNVITSILKAGFKSLPTLFAYNICKYKEQFEPDML